MHGINDKPSNQAGTIAQSLTTAFNANCSTAIANILKAKDQTQLQTLTNLLENTTDLNLIKTNIDQQGLEMLWKVINDNPAKCKLTSIDLSHNKLTDRQIGRRSPGLFEILKWNTTIKTLNFSNNLLYREITNELSNVLKINQTITTINFESNLIESAGATEILTALKDNNSVTSLNLAYNPIRNFSLGTQIEFARLSEPGYLKKQQQLAKENSIAKCLETNTILTILNLKGTYVDTEGMKQLAELIKAGTSLTSLDLREVPINIEGIRFLSGAVRENLTLLELHLGNETVPQRNQEWKYYYSQINETLLERNNIRQALKNDSLVDYSGAYLAELAQLSLANIASKKDRTVPNEIGTLITRQVIPLRDGLTTAAGCASKLGYKATKEAE